MSPKKRLLELRGHNGGSGDVAFSPDGATLASAGVDGTIRLWDPLTGKELATLRGHEGRVTRITFHPEGVLIASGSDDGTVRIWDCRTRTLLSSIQVGTNV